MLAKINLLLVLLVAVNLLTGCLRTREDVKDAEEAKLLQTQVNSMQKANADYVSRVEEALENHRSLSGRVEMLENKVGKIEETDSQRETGSKNTLLDIADRLKTLQETVSKMQEEQQAMAAELAALKQAKGKDSLGSAANADSGESLFAAGEALFKQKKWKEAILKYDEYKKKNAKGKSLPESTYKMGVCFQELGLKEDAKVFYQEVITKFPKTEFMHKAQTRMRGL